MPTLNWIGKQAVLNHHKEILIAQIYFDRTSGLVLC